MEENKKGLIGITLTAHKMKTFLYITKVYNINVDSSMLIRDTTLTVNRLAFELRFRMALSTLAARCDGRVTGQNFNNLLSKISTFVLSQIKLYSKEYPHLDDVTIQEAVVKYRDIFVIEEIDLTLLKTFNPSEHVECNYSFNISDLITTDRDISTLELMDLID